MAIRHCPSPTTKRSSAVTEPTSTVIKVAREASHQQHCSLSELHSRALTFQIYVIRITHGSSQWLHLEARVTELQPYDKHHSGHNRRQDDGRTPVPQASC